METYPVSEDAIQSYYLSYPDKFMINKEGAKEDGQKQEVSALDDGIKSFIRNKIVFSKKAVIIDDEFKRLKTKYHVIVE